MYAKITNGEVDQYPYTIGQLRRDNPNISFPKKLSDDLLESFGVFPVSYTDAPQCDERTQKIEQDKTPSCIGGIWVVGWSILNSSSDEIAQKDLQKAISIRDERDMKLAKTDWRFCSDLTPSQAWKDYRQALRDVPSQAGFPWSIEWPSMPE